MTHGGERIFKEKRVLGLRRSYVVDGVDHLRCRVRDKSYGAEKGVSLLLLQLFVPHQVRQQGNTALRPTGWQCLQQRLPVGTLDLTLAWWEKIPCWCWEYQESTFSDWYRKHQPVVSALKGGIFPKRPESRPAQVSELEHQLKEFM